MRITKRIYQANKEKIDNYCGGRGGIRSHKVVAVEQLSPKLHHRHIFAFYKQF